MPLLSGKSNIGRNIRELHHGKTYAKTAAKFGAQRAHRQSIAIAMDKARESDKPKLKRRAVKFQRVEE